MILGAIFIILEIITLWEMVYLWFVISLKKTSKPMPKRSEFRHNSVIPDIIQSSVPQPSSYKYHSKQYNGIEQQLGEFTQKRMVITPSVKKIYKVNNYENNSKHNDDEQRQIILFFPHDGILWLLAIIKRLYTKCKQNQFCYMPSINSEKTQYFLFRI